MIEGGGVITSVGVGTLEVKTSNLAGEPRAYDPHKRGNGAG